MIPNLTAEIKTQAWADAHAKNELEALASAIETFRADSLDPDPFVSYTASERLKAYASVYEGRLAALRLQAGKGTQRDRDRQAWIDLARTVKERVPIVDILELRGIEVTPHGKELHSACPFCGGVDRFVIWLGPPDRAWCRRCHNDHQRMDVIALVQSVISGCEHFHSAVAFLDDLAATTRGSK